MKSMIGEAYGIKKDTLDHYLEDGDIDVPTILNHGFMLIFPMPCWVSLAILL